MIVFYLKDLKSGGVQKIHSILYKGIKKRGFKSTMLVNTKDKLVHLKNEKKEINELGTGKFRRIRILKSIIKENEKNLIVVGNGMEALVSISVKMMTFKPVKIVYVQHVDVVLRENTNTINLARCICFPIAAIFCDKVVVVSMSLRKSLLNRYPFLKNKICCIYNPVLESSDSSNYCHNTSVVTNSEINLLNVGRLTYQKNQKFLLEVLGRLNRNNPNYKYYLHLLGDGEDRKDLEIFCENNNLQEYVFFHGWKDNVQVYMKGSDIFCLSSIWEGLPTVLIEALAYCQRVVAYDCLHGVNEILVGGKAGILVKNLDVEEFCSAIKQSLTKPPPTTTLRSLDRFEVHTAISSYSALFQEIL